MRCGTSSNAGSRAYEPNGRSSLLELDQGGTEVFRMQEQDRLAVGADGGRPIAEHPGAGGGESGAGGLEIVDLEAQMMHAAVGVAP